MFCNCWSKNCYYPNTCLADGTLGPPHFMASFSSVSKSPLPACWKMHYLLATGEIKKHDKIGIRSMLPLLGPRFLYQNSDSVCEQAQPMSHPLFRSKQIQRHQNQDNKDTFHEKFVEKMKIKDLTWINLAALRSPRARVSIPLIWARNMSSTSVLSLRLKNHIIKVIT